MKLTSPGFLLRLEGSVALAFAVWLYARTGGNWLLFALLILAPDLSMLGYLAGARVGSVTYNIVHTYALPALLGVVAWQTQWPLGLSLALIWLAHIGADRLLGFGLKYPTEFKSTHLNRV
ncbi:MAG: DUF4260 domain-containing protein [Anaerolineales bacterium]